MDADGHVNLKSLSKIERIYVKTHAHFLEHLSFYMFSIIPMIYWSRPSTKLKITLSHRWTLRARI